jgi:nucleolar complex protein 2
MTLTQISSYFLSEECFAFRIKQQQPTETKGKRKKHRKEREAIDEDIVEDLVLSSDEDLPSSDSPSAGKNADVDQHLSPKQNRKPKHKTKRIKRNKSHK